MPAATINIPQYKQSKNLRSALMWVGNADSTGLVTWGTPVDLSSQASGTATYESFTLDPTTNDVSLRPADSTYENMATEYGTYSCSLSELSPANGPGNLTLAGSSYTYFRIIIRHGPIGASSSLDNCYAVIGKFNGVTTGLEQGKNVDVLSLVPCGKPPYIGLYSGLPANY